MILMETRKRNLITCAFAWLAFTLIASPTIAQLQIPKKAGKKFPLDPAKEIAKQSTGLQTIKLKRNGKNFYGSPLGFDGKKLALLRWDGRISYLPANKDEKIEVIDKNFLPYTNAELKDRLKKEFGSRYAVSTTEHYVVVHPHGTAEIWAEPFEKLHQSFVYWCELNGLTPTEPKFPLVAIVLRSRRDFDLFMKNELKIANRGIQGFYHNTSNRMVMFDPSSKLRVEDETWLYRHPTIVHEATHQSAFNTKIQNRFSPPPLWMAEGLAMLFEAPGYSRSKQFKKADHRINKRRLAALRKLKPQSSLPAKIVSVVGDNRLFETNPLEYYTLSWALTWFLAEERHDQLIRFMKADAARKPFTRLAPADELKLFARHFGNDMEQLKREIRKFYEDKL
ncbi:DUF1570 domain-containing protein [Mariniblastus sp.]|nr:DUF1570 domain-containing protein [Mariniblastus sp.]